MAKKTRIDRRGKIRSLTRGFKPDGRLHWKKKKLLTILANRRQWAREFDPAESLALEILLENGTDYLVTEASTTSSPTYIITE